MNKYLTDDEFYCNFKKNKLLKTNNNIVITFSDVAIKDINRENIELLSEKIKNFLIILEKNCKNFNSKLFIKNFQKTVFNINKYYSF